MTEMDEHAFLEGPRTPRIALPGGPRRWVEDSFRLLTEHFGTDPLRRPAVVPGEFVPTGYDGSEAAARELCAMICERMGVPFEQVQFSFRLETVMEAAELLGSVLLDRYVDPDDPFAHDTSPGDVAAVRTHSARLGTAGVEQVDRILEADSGVSLEPIVQRLAIGEFGAEVVRCLLIASGSRPEQRATSDVRRAPAVGLWLDLGADCPGLTPIPGQSAVLLRSDVLADPLKLLAATSHELSHELLSRAELPWATGPLEEPLTDLCALFHGFGIALVNAAVDETTLDD